MIKLDPQQLKLLQETKKHLSNVEKYVQLKTIPWDQSLWSTSYISWRRNFLQIAVPARLVMLTGTHSYNSDSHFLDSVEQYQDPKQQEGSVSRSSSDDIISDQVRNNATKLNANAVEFVPGQWGQTANHSADVSDSQVQSQDYCYVPVYNTQWVYLPVQYPAAASHGFRGNKASNRGYNNVSSAHSQQHFVQFVASPVLGSQTVVSPYKQYVQSPTVQYTQYPGAGMVGGSRRNGSSMNTFRSRNLPFIQLPESATTTTREVENVDHHHKDEQESHEEEDDGLLDPSKISWAKRLILSQKKEKNMHDGVVVTGHEALQEECKSDGVSRGEGVEESKQGFVEKEKDVEEEQTIGSLSRIYSLEFLLRFRDYVNLEKSSSIEKEIPQYLLVNRQQPHYERKKGRHCTTEEEEEEQEDVDGCSWRRKSGPVIVPLEKRDDSWAESVKREKVNEEEDAIVQRSLRSLLNKLTIDKLDKFTRVLLGWSTRGEDNNESKDDEDDNNQMLEEEEVGGGALVDEKEGLLSSSSHLCIFVKLVFEKATQQHTFIPMYAELCRRCACWLRSAEGRRRFVFPETREEDNNNNTAYSFFRRLLLESCQDAFESFLKPASSSTNTGGTLENEGLAGDKKSIISHNFQVHDSEIRLKYKLKMFGNIRLIANLIKTQMISSKIAIACIKQLIQEGEEIHLEGLCIFLTEVGPILDRPDHAVYAEMNECFLSLEGFVTGNKKLISTKTKFLMMNVLELREAGWVADNIKINKKSIEQEASATVWRFKNQQRSSASNAKSWNTTNHGSKDDQDEDKKGGSCSSSQFGGGVASAKTSLNNASSCCSVSSLPSEKASTDIRKDIRSILRELKCSRDMPAALLSFSSLLPIVRTSQSLLLETLLLPVFESPNSGDRKLLVDFLANAFKENEGFVSRVLKNFCAPSSPHSSRISSSDNSVVLKRSNGNSDNQADGNAEDGDDDDQQLLLPSFEDVLLDVPSLQVIIDNEFKPIFSF